MKTLRFLAPGLLAAAIILAACGGGDDSPQDSTPEATTKARATATAPVATATTESSQEPTATASEQATAIPPTTEPANVPPTQPPPPPPPVATSTPVPPPPPAQSQSFTIVAKGSVFVQRQIFATLGGTINVTLDNQDASVAHDLIVYTPAGGIAAQTGVISGPATDSASFTPSGTGNYFFKCSLHPQSMTGTIAVQ